MITSLIYYSKSSKVHSLEDIRGILKSAQNNNVALGVTGALLYNEHYFFQILEGDRKVVSELYAKIQKDSRHEEITLVHVSSIPARNFEQWSMKHINIDEESKNTLLKYTSNGVFNPEIMSSESLLSFAKSMTKRHNEEVLSALLN